MKRRIIAALVFMLTSIVVHAYPALTINDTGVRLRSFPGLKGDIIRILDKGEPVTMLGFSGYHVPGFEPDPDDEYNWINVETKTGTGWVYGEFVSHAEGIVLYKINSLDAVKLSTERGIIATGMEKEALIAALGAPLEVIVEESRKLEGLRFDINGKLFITISQFTNRVEHIIVDTPGQELVNGIRVGIPIQKVLCDDEYKKGSPNDPYYSLPSYFKIPSYYFDCAVFFETDDAGIITQIQLATPG
jgi:hypothetical protein